MSSTRSLLSGFLERLFKEKKISKSLIQQFNSLENLSTYSINVYSDQPKATFKAINTALLMAKPIVKSTTSNQKQGQPATLMVKPIAPKQKRGQLIINSINKQA